MQRMRPFELHAVKMSLHIIQAVCCRTVPHAGFAAIQDDNLFFGTRGMPSKSDLASKRRVRYVLHEVKKESFNEWSFHGGRT
jgi:hypothetical protein